MINGAVMEKYVPAAPRMFNELKLNKKEKWSRNFRKNEENKQRMKNEFSQDETKKREIVALQNI